MKLSPVLRQMMDSIELLIAGSKSSIYISDLSLEIKHTTCLGTLDNSLGQ